MKVAFTIGAEAADARNVTVQLKQDRFLDRLLGSARVIDAYVSSDAAGQVLDVAGTESLTEKAGGAGAVLSAVGGGVVLAKAVTDATGKVELKVSNSDDSAQTLYLNVVTPDGKVYTSSALTFIDNP